MLLRPRKTLQLPRADWIFERGQLTLRNGFCRWACRACRIIFLWFRPSNFIVCKSHPGQVTTPVGRSFGNVSFYWVSHPPRLASATNVVTARGNWRKLSLKQKVRAIGDRVFVEKDRLLGSALTCTGLTWRPSEKRWRGTTRQLAAIRFLYLDVIEDTRKYSSEWT